MTFRIMARTILELGAELISSDGIALYELIKNSIDADSRRVRIDVQIRIGRPVYDILVERLDREGATLAEVRAQLAIEVESPDLSRMRQSVVDDLVARITALRRRNALLATLDDWYCEHDWLQVSDTGHGMSLDDLEFIYLTIGTRSRRQQRAELDDNDEVRAPLGEKGVGRLSTMRLGDILEVETSKTGERRQNFLRVDWSLFSHDSDALLEEVDVAPERGPRKADPEASGTVVTIRHLKDEWSLTKLRKIAEEEFAKLVDPFESAAANRILHLTFNRGRVYVPEIDRRYLDLAHGSCRASFRLNNGRPELTGDVDYALRGKGKPFRLNTEELTSVAGLKSSALLLSLGSFDVDMWWFNRRLLAAVEDLGSRSEISKEIAKWSGGLMLFRDGYRVNPYGSGSDDWLELDKRAFASRGFKLNRQQVVGRVKISWRNRQLIDQTNREGLTDTWEKRVLIKLLQHVLLTEFKAFVDREDKAARIQERTTLENIEEKIESAEGEVKAKLRQIERVLAEEHRYLVAQALAIVRELTSYLAEAKALSEEVAQDRAQLVHLAGIGLMVEFIMHELERTTSATLMTLSDIDRSSLERPAASAVSVLTDQLRTIHKRVANLDPVSAARRQTKEPFDVYDTVRQVVEGRGGQIARHGVIVDGSFREEGTWRVKAVRGMFIQILENLLSNSFYWVKHQHALEPTLEPRITIELDPSDKVITVTDNGPGVDPAMASEIFQPFVTRRPAGEGHGLGLYISREIANYHGWSLDVERASTTRPDRYNTFALDLGGQ